MPYAVWISEIEKNRGDECSEADKMGVHRMECKIDNKSKLKGKIKERWEEGNKEDGKKCVESKIREGALRI